MLIANKKTYSKTVNQIIVLKLDGTIIDNDTYLFNSIIGKCISEIHPFFETLLPSLIKKDQEIEFLCINLDLKERDYIIDLSLKTFKDEDYAIIIIDDLTKQYKRYQPIAQLRNESKIKAEVLAFQN